MQYVNKQEVMREIERVVLVVTNRRAALASRETSYQIKPVILSLLIEDENKLDFYRALLTVNSPVGEA